MGIRYPCNYSDLSASIGLSFAALDAGSIPNTIPIKTAEENAIRIALIFIRTVAIELNNSAIHIARTIPIIPADKLNITDSVKN